jgi:hypothetical protein
MEFEKALNGIGVIIGIIMLFSVVLALTSCTHRTHVITEYDGSK